MMIQTLLLLGNVAKNRSGPLSFFDCACLEASTLTGFPIRTAIGRACLAGASPLAGAYSVSLRGRLDFLPAHYHGKTPYTYQILFRRHIRPAIEKISGLKSSKQAPIGWHTLRRSLATLLISNGENVKVAQSQLRHTTPKTTLELYAQAVSADQQKAHKKVVQMVLPMNLSEKLRAREATAPA